MNNQPTITMRGDDMIRLTIMADGEPQPGILRIQVVTPGENPSSWILQLQESSSTVLEKLSETDFMLMSDCLVPSIRLDSGVEPPKTGTFTYHFQGSGEEFVALQRLAVRSFLRHSA